MALSDIVILLVFSFVFVVILLSADYSFTKVFDSIDQDLPTARAEKYNASWNNNVSFFNNSFSALWAIFALISLALALLLPSHPVFLIIWLLLNLVMIWLYDTLEVFLQKFLESDLDTGAMDQATNFVDTTLPKAALVLNMLVGIVLFGKRVVYG